MTWCHTVEHPSYGERFGARPHAFPAAADLNRFLIILQDSRSIAEACRRYGCSPQTLGEYRKCNETFDYWCGAIKAELPASAGYLRRPHYLHPNNR